MDHLSRSLLNSYSAQPLQRCSLERKSEAWLLDQMANTNAEYIILNGHSVVCINRAPVILSHQEYHALTEIFQPLLLGLKKVHNTAINTPNNTPVFLVNMSEPEKLLQKHNAVDAENIIENLSLREITPDIAPEIAAMLSYATMLNHWHLTTRFCTRCGSSLIVKEGGALQQCARESCAHTEYPRINSAVIMRVTKGNKILLARQENWPENMYSVLAGFVEVGETLEHAVAREVMEEVNLAVENINYHSSQPWPFPNSLMLGYTAEATSETLDFEQDDIEHALWLTADELKSKILNGSIMPSSEVSISHRLIDDWFQGETGTSLSEFISTSLA